MSSKDRKLIVAFENQIIGTVIESGDILSFSYEDSWIGSKDAFDIAPQFRRVKKTHIGIEVKNFLENLLPEETNRKAIATATKVDAKDIVGLLEITGRDSAGALQIYSEQEFKELKYDPDKVRTLKISELAEGIDAEGTGINYITKIGLKPSLSGAQDKIACRYNLEAGDVSFPLAGGATTHIVKPNNVTQDRHHKTLELSALNELICLRLGQKILKNIPKNYFYESESRDLFVIERYDREVIGKKIKRIHQFDFCQYFGLSSADKYEVGGARSGKGKFGVKQIIEALREVSEAPTDPEKVLDWVVFNYLVHNTDSHLKNISMIATGTGFKLAPFYDITSVGFYQENRTYLFDNQFAFEVGGESGMNDICDIHWKKYATELGLTSDYFLLKIRDMSYEISRNLKNVYEEIKLEIKNSRNLKGSEKVLKFIGMSMEEKSIRCLKNTNLRTKENKCSVCGKPLGKDSVLNIGTECLKKLN